MEIRCGKLRLSRLTIDDIETVRNWRNDPRISRFMPAKGFITPEKQLEWFKSINNNNNYYFIIAFDDRKIGLAEAKKIDYPAGG